MKNLLVGLVVLLSITAFVNAAEEAAAQDLGVTVDLTYVSKYMWRGVDLYGNDSAWQPSVSLDLGSGFSAGVWMSYAGSKGQAAEPEYNYTLGYSNTILEDSVWKTDYSVGYCYYDYISEQTKGNDLQEVSLAISMPALLECGIVPHAAYFQLWNAKNTNANTAIEGAVFDLGFGYDFTIDQAPELPMTFTWDIVYNDGAAVANVDHEWSHMIWGLSTSVTCPATGGTLTPAIYFQNSFEDTINDEDELWAALSYSFSF